MASGVAQPGFNFQSTETDEEHDLWLMGIGMGMRNRASTPRAEKINKECDLRILDMRDQASTSKAPESAQQRNERLSSIRLRLAQRRERFDLRLVALIMTKPSVCLHCHALKFAKKSLGMCCSNSKVSLQPLTEQLNPPELPFLEPNQIQSTSCKTTISITYTFIGFHSVQQILSAGYMPTFKVQGQIYHRIGSLLSLPEAKLLQIFFTGDEEREGELRSEIIDGTRRGIILNLQAMFHEHISLIRSVSIASYHHNNRKRGARSILDYYWFEFGKFMLFSYIVVC